jgi:hypothetical protein
MILLKKGRETNHKEEIVLIPARYLTLGLLVLLITIISITHGFCQDSRLSKILGELESNDTLKRRAARNDLTDYLDNIEKPKQEEVIDKLLLIIHDKSSSYQLKLGSSYSIGRIRTFFWKVKDQEKKENNLYELFKQTKDPTLQKSLDNTLMKAEGLYWDAINDYNVGKLSKDFENNAVNKFRSVFERFPKSTYASRAHYYLARYYTRVYLKRKDKEMRVDKIESIGKNSNATYHDYFKMVDEGKYGPADLMNARYYMALNFVLLGNFDSAIAELQKIKNSEIKDKYTIYVYEFYYSKGNGNGNVINKYFPSGQLAEYTIEYLQKNPKYSDDYLKDFVAHLNKFTPDE